MINLLTIIGGIMLSVIGYFLKKTMDELREVKLISYENQTEIKLMKNEHKNKYDNLTDKFDELKLTMTDLIKEIKELNKRIR